MKKKVNFNLLIFVFILLALGVGFLKICLGNILALSYWNEMANNPQLMQASLNQQNFLENFNNLKPFLKKDQENLSLSAKAVFSLFVGENEKELFDKNSNESLPIASLTKLISALVIIENCNEDQEIIISAKAAQKPGNNQGELEEGEIFIAKDLFSAMLVESNNTAALAFAQTIGEEEFVSLMNKKADDLGLASAYFSDPAGLDAPNLAETNKMNAKDMANLAKFILEENPEIFEILSLKEFNLFKANGEFDHKAENTNLLLNKIPLVISGKTGETPKSGGCLLLISQAPKSKGYLINVILDSPDRFAEMKTLINWLNTSYSW
jgi:D-alanyl-D-alanine carboxypeptidase (penicillin-binding protein 5/6)